MLAILLFIPLFLIRYGLLYLLNKEALVRAAHFAPMQEKEKIAFVIYQLATIAIFTYSFFIKVKTDSTLYYLGISVYLLGVLLLILSISDFALRQDEGLNTSGLYKLSRNPLYIAYFIYFCGGAILTQSFILLLIVVIFQISTHWIILAEERCCLDNFKEKYREYMTKTRRYL